MAYSLSLIERNYICESDKSLPEDEQTIFTLKPLSAKSYALLQDSLKIEQDEQGNTKITNVGTHSLNILKGGLVNWSNFKDAEGNETPFVKDMDENLSRIPFEIRSELANEIINSSILSGKALKN
jgi:hypothetical protein